MSFPVREVSIRGRIRRLSPISDKSKGGRSTAKPDCWRDQHATLSENRVKNEIVRPAARDHIAARRLNQLTASWVLHLDSVCPMRDLHLCARGGPRLERGASELETRVFPGRFPGFFSWLNLARAIGRSFVDGHDSPDSDPGHGSSGKVCGLCRSFGRPAAVIRSFDLPVCADSAE
jgi:hypothetical protein